MVLFVDERHNTGLACLLPGRVQDVLGFGQIVDLSVIAPAVGSEYQGCDEVELSVRSRACAADLSVRNAKAPSKVSLHWTVLVLHVLLGPTPDLIKFLFLVQLYAHHKSVGHSLCTGVIVLDVRNVSHVISYLKVNFVRSVEDFLEN